MTAQEMLKKHQWAATAGILKVCPECRSSSAGHTKSCEWARLMVEGGQQ